MAEVVMVRLDGTAADDLRLSAAESISEMFQGHIIGLFLNLMPPILPIDPDPIRSETVAALNERALAAGDRTQVVLAERLGRLNRPAELRRIDVQDSEIADVASREARSADAFVALRLAGTGTPRESEQLVEGVLFGSGRHLLLVSDIVPASEGFAHALIAWNGSREAARAMGEALPYLHKSREVTVVVVDRKPPVEFDAVVGEDAVGYLKLHGIEARLERAINSKVDIATTLMVEADRLRADLMVMGGYGRSPLGEWFMGGVTYRLLRDAPVPLLVAH